MAIGKYFKNCLAKFVKTLVKTFLGKELQMELFFN